MARLDEDELLARLRAHGRDPLAFSLTQPKLEHLSTSWGAVGLVRRGGVALCLGAPLCDPSDERAMVDLVRRAHRGVLWYFVGPSCVAAGGSGGELEAFSLGLQRTLTLSRVRATDARVVQGALRKARRAGLVFERVRLAALGREERAELAAIQAQYLAHRPIGWELEIISRPVTLREHEDVIVLRLRVRGALEPLGFAMLDPYWERGAIRGYLLNVLRYRRTKLWGLYYATLAAACEEAAREGAQEVCLGGYPAAVAVPHGAKEAWAAQRIVRWILRQDGALYAWNALRTMKTAVDGDDEPRFAMMTPGTHARAALGLLSASGFTARRVATLLVRAGRRETARAEHRSPT